MELTSEQRVTKLLQENEIIKGKPKNQSIISPYNLNDFLEKIKNEPSQYDARFMFIK